MAKADTAIDRFRFHFRRILFEKNRRAGDVAIKAGLSPAWASSFKQGAGISLGAADAVAKELGVDVGEFFGPQVYPQDKAAMTLPPALTSAITQGAVLDVIRTLLTMVPLGMIPPQPVPLPVPSSPPRPKPTTRNRRKK